MTKHKIDLKALIGRCKRSRIRARNQMFLKLLWSSMFPVQHLITVLMVDFLNEKMV